MDNEDYQVISDALLDIMQSVDSIRTMVEESIAQREEYQQEWEQYIDTYYNPIQD